MLERQLVSLGDGKVLLVTAVATSSTFEVATIDSIEAIEGTLAPRP